MFLFLTMIGVMGCIVFFFASLSEGFQNSFWTTFLSMLISTILCFKLAKMEKDLKKAKNDLKILKQMNGLEPDTDYEWKDNKKDEQ